MLRIAALFLIAFTSCQSQPQQPADEFKFSKEFSKVWERASDYTLETAVALPDERYSFKPERESKTFAEEILHITQNLYGLNSKYILETEVNPFDSVKYDLSSDSSMLTNLQKALGYVKSSLSKITDQEAEKKVIFRDQSLTKKEIFYLMKDHMTHHRAKMIVYLKMNRVATPKYVGY